MGIASVSTSHLLALADSLADRIARLDELFAKAGHRGASGLQPLLLALQAQAAESLQALVTAARSGSADRLVSTLRDAAGTVSQLHARLDLVPGSQAPTETEWLLADWLGTAAEGRVPPPVLLTLSPQVHATFLPGSPLCSLYLPLAERENPLAWTLLAHGLGLWVDAAFGLYERSAMPTHTPLQRWLITRLADRLAVRMLGPAYVFALAYGEPEPWFAPAGEGPSLLARLRWALADAQEAGFTHPQLEAVAHLAEALVPLLAGPEAPPADFAAQDQALTYRLHGFASLPTYAPAAFATAEAMVPDLREGLPISARPRLPQSEQLVALQHFKDQHGYQPGTAVSLLALLKDQANDAATILNAGWLYRNDLRASWLDELREAKDGVAALRHARLRGSHLDQLLQKSLETATIHRLLQETTP
jgi:hypothetical protein